MRRFAMAVMVVTAAACGGDGATDPKPRDREAAYHGVWRVTHLGGAKVPAAVQASVTFEHARYLMDGWLVIAPGRPDRFRLCYEAQMKAQYAHHPSTSFIDREYALSVRDDGAVLLDLNAWNTEEPVALSGETMTITSNGSVYRLALFSRDVDRTVALCPPPQGL